RYIKVLQRETERLQTLVDDLLHLSRLDLGAVSPQIRTLDLNRLVSSLVADRRLYALSKGVSLEAKLADPAPIAAADEDMIMQVLSNLTSNAIQYTPSGGKVTVYTGWETANGRRWATLTVADTGVGIAKEEIPYIFDRFYRGKAALETGAAGTGLGLSIVKEIVDRHQGQISVASAPGQGASFTVRLPAAKSASVPS
ncbi:MAG TPA: hypothetical protein EYH31_06565, partial [Anaerolineae bacterium]|nr:hypothetical protein [Anaerolineae bacterium]